MFIQSIVRGFAKCFDFNSRASRSDLCYFYLFAELLTIASGVIDNLIGLTIRSFQIQIDNQIIDVNIGPILIISFFLTLIPLTALRIRRLHDTNRSGFWYLIFILLYIGSFFYQRFSVIVFFGYINLIIIWCVKGTSGHNKYGDESSSVS